MYEGSLCVCCMSTEDLVQLFASGSDGGVEEDYGKLLAACLRIQLSEKDGHDFICIPCVRKLKDCLSFKVMTLKSISILSSVDLSELLTGEELQVLGLNKSEQNHIPGQDTDLVEATSEQNTAVLTKMKQQSKKIQAKLAPSDSDIQQDDHMENTVKGIPAVAGVGRGVRGTRGRGRPRVRSPDGLPYRLDRRELTCRECGDAFPNHITLKVHYNTHFGRHACAQCGKRFVTRASLAKHALAHRTGPFRCDQCQQEFSKMNTLLSHKRYKHGARAAYRCGVCPLRLRTLHARLAHRAAAHGLDARRHRCRYCGQAFRHSGEVWKHVATHHEVRLAECAVCGARLRRGSLRGHMRTHTQTRARRDAPAPRRFSCRLCGKAFSQKHSLLYHIGSHVRRGAYAGPPAALIQHSDTHHGLLSDSDSDPSEQTHDSDLSDHCPRLLEATANDDDSIQYIHYRGSSDDEDRTRVPSGDGRQSNDGHEIRTDLGFNIPSDFEE